MSATLFHAGIDDFGEQRFGNHAGVAVVRCHPGEWTSVGLDHKPTIMLANLYCASDFFEQGKGCPDPLPKCSAFAFSRVSASQVLPQFSHPGAQGALAETFRHDRDKRGEQMGIRFGKKCGLRPGSDRSSRGLRTHGLAPTCRIRGRHAQDFRDGHEWNCPYPKLLRQLGDRPVFFLRQR
jgi:hypothetical protein